MVGLLLPQRSAADPAGGTAIVNVASVTYRDAQAHQYRGASNAVVATVAELSAIVISPNKKAPTSSDGVAVGSDATRIFTIYNTSNITDAYQLESLDAGSLSIVSVAWLATSGSIATGVNGSVSPNVAPGGSIQVRVVISTNALKVGQSQSVTLGAHTTVKGTTNGLAHASGEDWIVGATGPSLTGPSGSSTQIAKTVNGVVIVQSQPGATVHYAISMMNSGGAPATNVKVVDPVPTPLAIVAGSTTIDGQPAGSHATISGQTLTYDVATLAPGATLTLGFDATLPAGSAVGESFVNVATVSADNASASATTSTNVFAGVADIVFDGYTQAPVAGARVTLLDSSGTPMLPSVSSGANGAYGFNLPLSTIGSGATYFLTVAAPNYLNRRIELQLAPSATPGFYNVVLTSLDGQPLAIAGGFTLTTSNVKLADLLGIFGNLPLFASRSITVNKTVDRAAAAAGDALTYTVTVQNQTPATLFALVVNDVLPPDMTYVRGTARVEGTPLEPIVSGRSLIWTLSQLAAGETQTITYATTILASAAVGSTLTNVATASAPGPGGGTVTGSGSASVQVLDGPFTPRRVVTGRVFLDVARTGYFTRGDKPLAGVRVVMEDGSFAVTDTNGLFSFPSVRPGEHVLRLDPLTIPGYAMAEPGAPMNSTRATQRLLHGVLDDATMEDVEFALEPRKP